MKPEEFLTPDDEKRIINAIRTAEKNTSGEIRVHLESSSKQKPNMQYVWEVFEKIGMKNTRKRNGVLIYIDINRRFFTIIGDEGINKGFPENFWDNIKNEIIIISKGIMLMLW